jgi:hypothetical protein
MPGVTGFYERTTPNLYQRLGLVIHIDAFVIHVQPSASYKAQPSQ